GGEDALRGVHAVDVLGAGLDPHQDHLAALRLQKLRLVGREHDLARGGARRGRQAGRDHLPLGRSEEHTSELPSLTNLPSPVVRSPRPMSSLFPYPTLFRCGVVRMPSEACMPWMSSGLVSTRTRITLRPCVFKSSASSDENTISPEAAPGEAGRPVAITCRS